MGVLAVKRFASPSFESLRHLESFTHALPDNTPFNPSLESHNFPRWWYALIKSAQYYAHTRPYTLIAREEQQRSKQKA